LTIDSHSAVIAGDGAVAQRLEVRADGLRDLPLRLRAMHRVQILDRGEGLGVERELRRAASGCAAARRLALAEDSITWSASSSRSRSRSMNRCTSSSISGVRHRAVQQVVVHEALGVLVQQRVEARHRQRGHAEAAVLRRASFHARLRGDLRLDVVDRVRGVGAELRADLHVHAVGDERVQVVLLRDHATLLVDAVDEIDDVERRPRDVEAAEAVVDGERRSRRREMLDLLERAVCVGLHQRHAVHAREDARRAAGPR
jgi:hypothetical protein